MLREGYDFSNNKNADRKEACEVGHYEKGQAVFGMIMVLTDAYEQLRHMGCYCKLKAGTEECSDEIVDECPNKALFKKLEGLYTPALRTFQTLDLKSWRQSLPSAEAVLDAGIKSATTSKDTLKVVQNAVSKGAKGAKIGKAAIVKTTKVVAQHLDNSMDLLSSVDPSEIGDIVSLSVSAVSIIYSAASKTSGYDNLEEQSKAKDNVKLMKSIATGISITSAIIGACTGEPTSYFFLAGEVVSQGVSRTDEYRARQAWLKQFAPALEKELDRLDFGKFVGLKFGSNKCGHDDDEATKEANAKKIKAEVAKDKRRFVWYYDLDKDGLSGKCKDLDSYFGAEEDCKTCKELPFCKGKLKSGFFGTTCECKLDKQEAGKILAYSRRKKRLNMFFRTFTNMKRMATKWKRKLRSKLKKNQKASKK